jgi:hypothetical protein
MRRIGFAKDLRVLTRPHSRADAGYGSDQPEMASREQLGRDTQLSMAPAAHLQDTIDERAMTINRGGCAPRRADIA